jgi:hypothetical protein
MSKTTTRRNLISNTEHRLEEYRKLVSLSEEQREILVENRISELETNLQEQDLVLVKLSELEEQAEDVVETALESLSGTEKSRYEELDAQIADTALRLREIVNTNAELLDNAMQFVGFSMSLVSQLCCEQQSYNPTSDGGGNHAIVFDKMV